MNTDIAIYSVLCISALSLILTIYALTKLKLLVYLFDQPEVKKLSSSVKLKLKKVDRGSLEEKKPSKPRQFRSKTGGHQAGKDNRGAKSSSRGGDRYKDRNKNSRPPRGGVRGDKARGTVVGNQSAIEETKTGTPVSTEPVKSNPSPQPVKTEAAKKESTNGHTSTNTDSSARSEGRRPLPARSEPQQEPAADTSAAVNEPAQPKTEAPAQPAAANTEIQHGRRTRIKKNPTFEE